VANKNRYFYRSPGGTFAISTPIFGQPATYGNGSTLGFSMASPEQADAFHAAGVANGGTTCEDPPGYREGPAGKIYLAYLRDPDGNKLCALHRPAK
jgi:catechol 2,3-dioxygenase-like lactoylglutathione lyase family enzyme